MTQEKIGAVMVAGGGIGGVQAALDLAESGFKVYMVEEKPGIGGVMAQLDKTFPTNDCSACILSPKLVTVGQNPSIDIMAYSRIEGITGEPGNFKVKVRVKSRFIDVEKCKNCGDCASVCPVPLPDEYNEALNERKAAYRLFPQTIPQAFLIEKAGRAPCVVACPAHIKVQGYVQLIKDGKYKEAVELIYRNLPFPGVLGRVCPHPCERVCRRAEKDQPVAICKLKRFVADHVDSSQLTPPNITPRDEKVAVIGSGPAGLSAAYYLALAGYKATIFESAGHLGGWLRYGIPEFRLPRDVVDKEINYILSLGVEAKTNTTLGKDFNLDDLKGLGYKAIYLAVGCRKGAELGIPGQQASGVIQAVELLERTTLGNPPQGIKKAVVIGGGHPAIDTARTLVRLGADASVLYRRSKDEVPSYNEDIAAAEQEGVKIHYLSAPLEVVVDGGKVKGLRCVKMELGPADQTGRRRPLPVAGSEFVLDADAVVPAIGQVVDPDFWSAVTGLAPTKWNTVQVDPVTFATPIPGVFAGGDATTGPATVIEAVAAGREAAESISRFIQGIDLAQGRPEVIPGKREYPPIPKKMRPQPRVENPVASKEERKSFKEVDRAFSEQDAKLEAERCLNCGICSECLECVKACPAGAVDHSMKDEIRDVEVGAVILCPGFELADAERLRGEYAYGQAPNVVTNIQFERILSASGPYAGEVRRPSDGAHPRKVAWIQCVCSRDPQRGMPHCSSICCMASIKEAVIAKEHDNSIEPTIFFMDIRAYGKEFDKYYEKAQGAGGVRFVRSMVSRVVEDPKTNNLNITFVDGNGRIVTETFDLVVLAVGIKASDSTLDTAKILGVELDENKFCDTSTFAPVATSRPGVFVAGAFQAPKDIPQTVMEASASAGVAIRMLAESRNTLTTKKELIAEKDLTGEEPRVGVFVCRCGINIAATVDVPQVVQRIKDIPGVAYVTENLFTCSQDTQVQLKEIIEKHKLNRVLVASCTPRTHLPLFQETAREAGLNKYLVEMANIREHCSWVHMQEKEAATNKAVDLIRMAIARTARLEQVQDQRLPMVSAALVVGGGVAGMTAALNIVDQGFPVDLVEASDKLGGNALKLTHTMKGEDVRSYVDDLEKKVVGHERIKVHLNSRIAEVAGFIGNFKTKLSGNGSDGLEVEHGVAVIATGASEWTPDLYGYGEDPRIRTHLEMSAAIKAGDPGVMEADSTVFIQCVGSRTPERPWCSKVCCNHTVSEAIALKEANPKTSIYVLYRDIRTYGLNEPYYEKARRLGVVFVRYEPSDPPVVETGTRIGVRVKDLVLGRWMTIQADNLVLAAAIVPHKDNGELGRMFKVSTNEDGYFLEAHMKLRPVDFATDGVFLAGLAHYPKPLDETIAQAEAAGSHAAQVLARGYVEAPGMVSAVDEYLCRGCGRCADACPFEVPRLREVRPGVMLSEINPALCKGCGVCAVVCPTGAAQVRHFKDDQIGYMIDAAMNT
ncbi:MAG: FAD-dependent oxidoreductase [Pseudomonadota bacterium]